MAISRKECSCKFCHQTDCTELDYYSQQVKCLLCLRFEGYEEFVVRNTDAKEKKEQRE